jgi:hypothetical protein
MSSGTDRRPWLILSRREGQALLAAVGGLEDLTPDLRRARAQLRKQLAWINGQGEDEPSKDAAVEREYARQ